MCMDGEKIYIYGGLGCEPNLKLAVYDIETKKWSFLAEDKYAQCMFFVIWKIIPVYRLLGTVLDVIRGKGTCMAGSRLTLWMNCRLLIWRTWSLLKGKGASLEERIMPWLWSQSSWSFRVEYLRLKSATRCSSTTQKPTPGLTRQSLPPYPSYQTTVWPPPTLSSLKRNLSPHIRKSLIQSSFSEARIRKVTCQTRCIRWDFKMIPLWR